MSRKIISVEIIDRFMNSLDHVWEKDQGYAQHIAIAWNRIKLMLEDLKDADLEKKQTAFRLSWLSRKGNKDD